MLTHGWTAITEMMYGLDLIWNCEHEGKRYPDIYATRAEVQEEINSLASITGDDDDSPAYIEIEAGIITVWTDETKAAEILTIPFTEWSNDRTPIN